MGLVSWFNIDLFYFNNFISILMYILNDVIRILITICVSRYINIIPINLYDHYNVLYWA
jgi:hypothetical protein